MTYALPNGLAEAGPVLSGAFASGMIVTVALFPIAAVLLQNRVLPLVSYTAHPRIARIFEIGTAAAIMLLGIWPLMDAAKG